MAGIPAEGIAMVERTWRDTRDGGLRLHDAELQRVKGELLLLQGEPDARAEAETCFHAALEIAREQSARLYELRAATSLARLCRGRRNESDARAALARVYAGFTEGFDTPDLRAALECLRA